MRSRRLLISMAAGAMIVFSLLCMWFAIEFAVRDLPIDPLRIIASATLFLAATSAIHPWELWVGAVSSIAIGGVIYMIWERKSKERS